MAGPPEMMEQEDRFFSALPLTESVFLKDDVLWLESGEGSVVLQFRAKN